MYLVDVLVQRAPVQCSMRPVVPRILHDEEDGDLEEDLGKRRKGNAGLHAEKLSHWVEEPVGIS